MDKPLWLMVQTTLKGLVLVSALSNSAEGRGVVDLYGAATHFLGTPTWITLGAALLISTTAFIVMLLYVRAVDPKSKPGKTMAQPGPVVQGGTSPLLQLPAGPLEIQTEKPDVPRRLPPPRSPTFQHAKTAFRRAACIYTVGGSVAAATSAALLFLFESYSVPSTTSPLTLSACYAGMFWSWSFFTVVALALFCGPDRPLRGLLLLVYAGMLPLIGLLLELAGAPRLPLADVGVMSKDEMDLLLSFASNVTGQPVTAESVMFSAHLQPIVFWSLSAAPLIIPFLAFNRFVRGTVGPLFISSALMMLLSTFFINDLVLYTPPGVWFAVHLKRVFGDATFQVLTAISLALSVAVAWFGLVWIAGRYRRMKLSDQTFLFDALWL